MKQLKAKAERNNINNSNNNINHNKLVPSSPDKPEATCSVMYCGNACAHLEQQHLGIKHASRTATNMAWQNGMAKLSHVTLSIISS